MASSLYLLRHALSAPDPANDEAKWPLNAQGEKQADALVPVLSDLHIHQIYSSPYKRALQTVEPFASNLGLEIELDDRLREKKLTERWLDNHTEEIQKSWTDFEYRLDDGESNAACQRRIVRCIKAIAKNNQDENVLISSHGNAIGLYLNNIDSNFNFDRWQEMRWPELYRVNSKEWSRITPDTIPYLLEAPQKLT